MFTIFTGGCCVPLCSWLCSGTPLAAGWAGSRDSTQSLFKQVLPNPSPGQVCTRQVEREAVSPRERPQEDSPVVAWGWVSKLWHRTLWQDLSVDWVIPAWSKGSGYFATPWKVHAACLPNGNGRSSPSFTGTWVFYIFSSQQWEENFIPADSQVGKLLRPQATLSFLFSHFRMRLTENTALKAQVAGWKQHCVKCRN